MKKTLLSFALLFGFYILCSAQNAYDDPVYNGDITPLRFSRSDNYTPHLVNYGSKFDLGLGLGTTDDVAYNLAVRCGYHFTNRLSGNADFIFTKWGYTQFLATFAYTYEAIPSIRGGFYFDIGLSAGVDTYDLFNKEYQAEVYPFVGPSLIFKHHLFEGISLVSRVSYNALTLARNYQGDVFASGAVMLVFTL